MRNNKTRAEERGKKLKVKNMAHTADGGVSGGPALKALAVAKENCKAENSKSENSKPADIVKADNSNAKDAAKEAKEKEALNDAVSTPSGDQKGCFGTGHDMVCARTLAAEAAKRRECEERRELSQLRELISVLGTLRTKGVLCDVIVTVDGRRFKAHKAILASGCGYFRTLFSQMDHQPSEGCKTEVIIQSRDVTSNSFDNMLDYVYTGKLRPLVWETIFETLACACYLQIKNAIQVSGFSTYFAYLAKIICILG